MEIIFVSVHVRRTDFKEWMTEQVGGFVASKEFYVKAMDYLRTKFRCQFHQHFTGSFYKRRSQECKKD